MKSVIVIIFPVFLLLTGCWSSHELTERGFVQGIAIDQNKEGKIKLTTQIYKPTNGSAGGSSSKGQQSQQYINVQTQNISIEGAIHNIPTYIGRNAHFSQMRIMIIGEKLAKKRDIREVIGYFVRDDESRLTTKIVIAQGEASDYLNVQPVIESTTSQQLSEVQKFTSNFSSKTMDMNLLQLAVQMKSEVNDAMVPFLYSKKKGPKKHIGLGIALLKNGKMVRILSSKEVEPLLLVVNKYQKGVLTIPCKKDSKKVNAFEVSLLQTEMTPKMKGNSLIINVSTKIEGSVTEMVCSSLETKKEYEDFQKNVKIKVKTKLQQAIKLLQKEKVDVIGVGNIIYRKNPVLWKRKWKKHWGKHFAKSKFTINVNVKIIERGNSGNKPFTINE